MTRHRFFLNNEKWGQDEVEVVSEKVSHQLTNVLRLKKGDQVLVLDNQGFEYQAEIDSLKPLRLKILSKTLNQNEPASKIALFQALIKKDKFEWVLQKGTEVGVSQFTPVLAARSEKKELGRPDRLQTILVEAAEQSARGRIPDLQPTVKFEDLRDGQKNVLNLLLDPGGEIPLSRYFPAIPAYSQINILVGPEGGFTPEEVDKAKEIGWEPVNLGPRILRTETAGVLAAGAILIATQGT